MDDHKFRNISFEINDQKLFILWENEWFTPKELTIPTELLPGFVTSIDSKPS